MPGYLKDSNSWKQVINTYAKVGGSWKQGQQAWVKVGGSWRQWFSSGISDFFNRVNSAGSLGTALSGQAWTNLRGVWNIVSNRAQSSSGGSNYPMATIDLGTTQNTNATASISGAGAGIAFWVTDTNSWWVASTDYSLSNYSVVTGCSTCCSCCPSAPYCYTDCCPRITFCQPSGSCDSWNCNCSSCCSYAAKTDRLHYLKIFRSVAGSVSNLVTTNLLTTTHDGASAGSYTTIAKIRLFLTSTLITLRGYSTVDTQIGSGTTFGVSAAAQSKYGVALAPATDNSSATVDDISVEIA
jgi:hypothetical protein